MDAEKSKLDEMQEKSQQLTDNNCRDLKRYSGGD
jgi:hypothetical protein